MFTLRWFPSLEFPLSSENMARVWAGVRLGLMTLAAVYLALWVGFEALIDEAGLAGITAAMLAMPDSGAVFAKGYARLIGTVLGAIACVALMWVFPQAPWLFAGGMALWMGFCGFWGGKIKYFGSYAAILSGYTAAFVTMETPNPEYVIKSAGERVSVIVIGILAVAFVWALLHIRKGFQVYLPSLLEMNDRLVAQVTQVVKTPESYDHVETMRQWARDIEAMHQRLVYGAAEDPEVSLHAKTIRCGLNEFFADIADFNARLKTLGEKLRDSPDRVFADEVNQNILAAFNARLAETDAQADQRFVDLRQKVLDYFAGQPAPNFQDRIRLLATVNAARNLINAMNRVRRGRETQNEEGIRPLGQATPFAHNFHNACAVMFAVMMAWGIYIVNEWQSTGPMFIVMVSVFMMMVSVGEDPVGMVKTMQYGAFGCVLPALLCQQVLMPLGSGFPWLILSLGVIIIPCSIIRLFPKTQAAGNLFMLFAMVLCVPDNQMNYNLGQFLNNTLALTAASILTLSTVLIFFPVRNREKARRIDRHGFAELKRVPSQLRQDRFSAWEDRQQERVAFIDRIGSLKGTVIARDSIEALLLMMRSARCFRRQHQDLSSMTLPPALTRLYGQVTWFWSRQLESQVRFQRMVQLLVEALDHEAIKQPEHQLELQAAAQEWRVIAISSQTLASLPC